LSFQFVICLIVSFAFVYIPGILPTQLDILEYDKALADSLGVSRICLIIVGHMSTAFAALGLGLISDGLLISIGRPLHMLSDQITGGLGSTPGNIGGSSSSQPVNAAVVTPLVANNFTPLPPLPPIGLFSLNHPVDNSHNNHSHYGNFCANSLGRDFYMLMHGREV